MIINIEDISLKSISQSDIDNYYKEYLNIDIEVSYLSGEHPKYSKETITNYINEIIKDYTRYDFLIYKNNNLLGEVSLYDIEQEEAYLKIIIFQKKYLDQKIGTKVLKEILNFGFNQLKLNNISLYVYKLNQRAIHIYEKLGFILKNTLKELDPIDKEHEDVLKYTLYKQDYFDIQIKSDI